MADDGLKAKPFDDLVPKGFWELDSSLILKSIGISFVVGGW